MMHIIEPRQSRFASGPAPADREYEWPETQEAVRAFVEMNINRFVYYAFRLLNDYHEAEDAVQEVLLRLFVRGGKRASTAPLPYTFRSLRNYCMDVHRKRNKRVVLVDVEAANRIASEGQNPAEAVQELEELRRVEVMLRHLPEDQAEVVRLRVFDKLRLHEIAEIVECSTDTVSSRLRYAFRKLREIVDSERGERS